MDVEANGLRMGLLRFLLPESPRVILDRLDLVYFAGPDGMPVRSQVSLQNQELHVSRDSDDSGKIHVPVHTKRSGLFLLPTGTVVERERPYPLMLELARGAVDRVRNQHELWERCGFEFSSSIEQSIASAASRFCEAAVRQQQIDECHRVSEAALDEALDAIDELEKEYANQVIALRKEEQPRLPTLYGFRLPMISNSCIVSSHEIDNRLPDETCNSVYLEVDWSQLEKQEGVFDFSPLQKRIATFREAGHNVAIGPVMRLDEDLLPRFIMDLERDEFEYLRRRVSVFAREITRALGSEIDVIEAFGGLNSIADLQMPIEYRLRLTIDVIEGIRSENADLPLLVGFDQPWCEGSIRESCLSPLQSADAIIRANLDVSGFVLELNWGITPSGTIPRDPLQWHHLLDLWSQFDVPIFISLAIPSCCEPDRQARFDDQCVESFQPSQGESLQQRQLSQWLDFLLSKPIVQGIFWNQLHDKIPHRYRHCGLVGPDGEEKPAMNVWRENRAKHLR